MTFVVVTFVPAAGLADDSGRIQLAGDRYVEPFTVGYEDGSSAHPFGLVISAVADVPANGTVHISRGVYPEALILRKPMSLSSLGGTVIIGAGVTWHLIDFPTPGGHEITDDDGDGIVDACEQYLAEEYAPIIYHSSDESNLPANVDWFLPTTGLVFYDSDCWPDLYAPFIGSPTQADLLGWWYSNGCDDTYTAYSDGTRGVGKNRTFFLTDVPPRYELGSLDSRNWTTYYHAYPNDSGGVTIQYWQFHTYNDAANNHGGDWETFQVILNRYLQPAYLRCTGHTSLDIFWPSEFEWEGTHPRIYCEGGGHELHPTTQDSYGIGIDAVTCFEGIVGNLDPADPCTCIRQETWTGGHVNWCDNPYVGFCNGAVTPGGQLLNLGAKIAPMNNQIFIRYSGIWGSPGTFFFTSGYWGPAFSETGMDPDGFITAWGSGIVNVDVRRECYPAEVSP